MLNMNNDKLCKLDRYLWNIYRNSEHHKRISILKDRLNPKFYVKNCSKNQDYKKNYLK